MLHGSTYKLEAVQTSQFIDVVRYELLYHIINSYEGSFIAKRAIVDFLRVEKVPVLVDWSEVKGEGKYNKIAKKEVQETKYNKILSNYPSLYP